MLHALRSFAERVHVRSSGIAPGLRREKALKARVAGSPGVAGVAGAAVPGGAVPGQDSP